MATITRDSLFSLEEYSKNRSDFKKKVCNLIKIDDH